MLNNVIKRYTLIFCSYISFTIDDITSCMYCGVHVGAPGLFLKPGVTLSLKTKVDSLSMVWPQNHWDSFSQFGLKTGGDWFPSLHLKTNSYGFVIWASKSP
jgi:hypothetical protein